MGILNYGGVTGKIIFAFQSWEGTYMEKREVKRVVKKYYGEIAKGQGCCCSCGCDPRHSPQSIAESIGYSEEEIRSFQDANLGLGCGSPTSFGEIREGETVLDLGSGAGFDCFLAAQKVGESGKVIGVDITEEMVQRARANAEKYGYTNVEFRLGDIEQLPVPDSSCDVVISNCVINLLPDKFRAFQEIGRVLKKGGRMYISDIVLLEELKETEKNDEKLIAGCVGGALLRDDYLRIIEDLGFEITFVQEDRGIRERQYRGLPVASLRVGAVKK